MKAYAGAFKQLHLLTYVRDAVIGQLLVSAALTLGKYLSLLLEEKAV